MFNDFAKMQIFPELDVPVPLFMKQLIGLSALHSDA